jgi:hypothetical protein
MPAATTVSIFESALTESQSHQRRRRCKRTLASRNCTLKGEILHGLMHIPGLGHRLGGFSLGIGSLSLALQRQKRISPTVKLPRGASHNPLESRAEGAFGFVAE